MIHYMNAGCAAESITLTDDALKSKISSAVTQLLRAENLTVSEGAVAKALFAGLAIVSTVSNVLRVPTIRRCGS